MDGKFGGTKLHGLAKSSAWSELLAHSMSEPSVLKTPDELNRNPLHYSLGNGAPSDTVLELIRLCPHQCRVRDRNGDYPIHVACEVGVDLPTIYGLLEADRKARGRKSALAAKNSLDKTPLDLVKGANRGKMFGYELGLSWKYHVEAHAGVLEAVEEATKGGNDVAGVVAPQPQILRQAAGSRRRGMPKSDGIPLLCVGVPWTPPIDS